MAITVSSPRSYGQPINQDLHATEIQTSTASPAVQDNTEGGTFAVYVLRNVYSAVSESTIDEVFQLAIKGFDSPNFAYPIAELAPIDPIASLPETVEAAVEWHWCRVSVLPDAGGDGYLAILVATNDEQTKDKHPHPHMFLIIDRQDWAEDGLLAVRLTRTQDLASHHLPTPDIQIQQVDAHTRSQGTIEEQRPEFTTMRVPVECSAGRLLNIEIGNSSWEETQADLRAES